MFFFDNLSTRTCKLRLVVLQVSQHPIMCIFDGYVGKLSAAGQLYMEHTASKIDALHTENDTSNKWKLHDGYPIECIKTESQVQ